MKEEIMEKIVLLNLSTNDDIWMKLNDIYSLKIKKNKPYMIFEIRDVRTNNTIKSYSCKNNMPELLNIASQVDSETSTSQYSMRSAFKRWLIIHNELYHITGYIRIPNWFRHYLRKNHKWTYIITNKDENHHFDATAKDWNSKRKYKGQYSFHISDLELKILQRPQWIK